MLEKEADNQVSADLAFHEIIVARPLADQNGTDLLALMRLEDGARFIRIQVKGRTVNPTKPTNVKIPKPYVTTNFVVFIYAKNPECNIREVLAFFSNEVEKWPIDPSGDYCLTLKQEDLTGRLETHKLTAQRIKKLKQRIEGANRLTEHGEIVPTSGYVADPDGDEWPVLDNKQESIWAYRNEMGWRAFKENKLTRTRSELTECPGHPKDFNYNPAGDVWIAKSGASDK